MPQSGSSPFLFDLNSQSGVMSVLASIRASGLTNQEKNELRDLVFHYTKNGGDASVRISLEQKLASYQIVPVQVRVSAGAAPGPALAFGSYRPVPTFKAPTVSPEPVSVAQNVVPVAPVVPVSVVAAPPVVVSPTPVVVTAPQQPVPVQVPTPAPDPTPAVAQGIQTTEAEYLERIRQIKTTVNSKVGNPVNLVDINNEVGREYMNALLEAMKKLSSGAISEMGAAMGRLEKAFSAVEVAIANHVPKTPAAVPVPSPLPVKAEPIAAPVIAEVTPTPLPTIQVVEVPKVAVVPPSVTEAPVLMTRPDITVPVPAAPVVPDSVSRDLPEPVMPVQAESVQEAPLIVEEKSGYEIATTDTPTSASLADKQKILTPQDLPDAATLSTGAAGDNLFTKEIDDGLTLLLSDWTIFKKSGLFGTGPKGREHPLFKKISELQIPLILAGRFEGSSQEIRQSITDYMNGWRYEQGIIYQPGETFEHYLRRVIRHIIDLQNKHR